MTGLTKGVYALFGTLAVMAGAVALVMPSVALPSGMSSPLTEHLVREEAAAFVFIGLMFFWCLAHYEQRRPVHLALVVFITLFAGIHWAGYLSSDDGEIISPLVNTVPALLLAATAPFRRP